MQDDSKHNRTDVIPANRNTHKDVDQKELLKIEGNIPSFKEKAVEKPLVSVTLDRINSPKKVDPLIDKMFKHSRTINNELARDIVLKFFDDADFADALTKKFQSAAKDRKTDYKHTAVNAIVESLSAIVSRSSTPALPDAAPRLWSDRPVNERGMSPAAFIREVYATWLDQGLTRAHIKKFDPPLYVAYAQWIRPERHPGDVISFAPSHMFNAYANPVEATEKRRTLAREARARQRAKAKADKLSHDM